MKLSKLELELIQQLRMAPISELKATIHIFDLGLVTAMNYIGEKALDDWNCICAGNINGLLEDIISNRENIVNPELILSGR